MRALIVLVGHASNNYEEGLTKMHIERVQEELESAVDELEEEG